MPRDQYTFINPAELYADIEPEKQHMPEPGLDADLAPEGRPRRGELPRHRRLTGRKALITGATPVSARPQRSRFAREARRRRDLVPARRGRRMRAASPGILREAGVKVAALPGDLRDPEYCRTSVADAVAALGGLDILVNNGGKQVYQESLIDITDEQFDDTFKTNVYAMFWITKAALPAPTPRRFDDHQPPRRSRRTRRPASSSTTPRPRRPSTRSRRGLPKQLAPEGASV